MKTKNGILILSLAILFACGEKQNSLKDKPIPGNPASAIMPDSALLQVDTAHLHTLRDSNLALFQFSELQGHYKDAMQYNAQYRLYNDSVLKVQRNRGIARIRATYDHETLIGRQQQLALKKSRSQTTSFILLSLCLSVSGALLLLHQHRMIRKVRNAHEAQKRIRELSAQIALNQLTIRSNEYFLQTTTGQLEQQTGLENLLREQQADIIRVNETNAQLLRDNTQLESEIKKHTPLLRDDNTQQPDIDLLVEEHKLLQEKETCLLKQLKQQLDIINPSQKHLQTITPEEEKELSDKLETIFPDFVAYLKKTFPNLSGLDLITCCLLKLQFTIPQIAHITGVDATSVSKRKLRIKEKMQISQPDLWEKFSSLDAYLLLY